MSGLDRFNSRLQGQTRCKHWVLRQDRPVDKTEDKTLGSTCEVEQRRVKPDGFTEKKVKENLRPWRPCSYNGTPVTAESLSEYLGYTVTGKLRPACGDWNCTEHGHWFVAVPRQTRELLTWFKQQKVVVLVKGGAPLSVNLLAKESGTSPRLVRETLQALGVNLPNRGRGKDGKLYSTTRKEARLRALADALTKAVPYLDPKTQGAVSDLLCVCRGEQ